MAAGWAVPLLVIFGATCPLWGSSEGQLPADASAAASHEPSTSLPPPSAAGALVTPPTSVNPNSSSALPPKGNASAAVQPTLSPGGRAFLDEVYKTVRCKKYSCGPENSVIPVVNSSHNCFCDAECSLAGECCPQIAPNYPGWRDPAAVVKGVQRRYWGCGQLRLYTAPENVTMVVTCPDGHVLQQQCARHVTNTSYDYKLDLPVLAADTGVWFQNVFCAVCHGSELRLRKQRLSFRCSSPNSTASDVAPSTPAPSAAAPSGGNADSVGGVARREASSILDNVVDTDDSYETENDVSGSQDSGSVHDDSDYNYVFKVLQEGMYQPGQLAWTAADGSSCHLQHMLTPKGPDEKDPWERPCAIQVDHCPVNWTGDKATSDLCGAYFYRVATPMPNSIVYRNPHCARCHNVSRLVRCRSTMGQRKGGRRVSVASLRIVMDYQWDPAREGCGSRGGVWDALHSRCQSLDEACPPATRYVKGRCVPAPQQPIAGSSTAPPNSSLTERDTDEDSDEREGVGGGGISVDVGVGGGGAPQGDVCPLITLAAGEFVLENDSLRLTLLGSPYYGEYVHAPNFRLLSDGRALVCNEYQAALLPVDVVQGYLTAACLSVSAICLLLHLIIHALLPKLHNLPGKNLQALSAALLLAQLGFLLGVSPPGPLPVAVCEAVAAAVHFFYLAAFCWMNVMSVDIWRTFSAAAGRTTANPMATHRRYAAYAWGLPAAVVALSLAADHTTALPPRFRPGYTEAGICWFGSGPGLGIYLAAPVTAILVCNIALFGVTVFQLHRRQEGGRYLRKRRRAEAKEASSHAPESADCASGATSALRPSSAICNATGPRDQIRFFLYVKLFVIMGATWMMGTLAALARWPALWYPFVVLNGLQGAFIFAMFDAKRTVMGMLWARLMRGRPPPALLRSPHAAFAPDSSRRPGTTGTAITTTTAATTTTTITTTDSNRRFSAEHSHNTDNYGKSLEKIIPGKKDDTKTENGLQTEFAEISNGCKSKGINKG